MTNYDEAMIGVQNTSLNMFWEYLLSSPNLASDWLRANRALLWMRKKGLEEKRKMDDSINISLTSEGTDRFVDLGEVQPNLWDPD